MMEKKKKNGLFSAIKRIFSSRKETDRKKGIWGHGETRSLFPLFRQPSSIEKILGEADQLNIRPRLFLESPKTQEKLALQKSARACSSSDPGHYPETFPLEANPSDGVGPSVAPQPHVTECKDKIIRRARPPSDPEPYVPECSNGGDASFYPAPCVKKRTCSLDRFRDPDPDTSSRYGGPFPRVIESRKETSTPASTAKDEHVSASKIQAAYRRYLARRSSRGSNGLPRLQEVMRGQSVRRQTMSAIKKMQLFVRVQTHIQSQRMTESQPPSLQHQSTHTSRDVESRPSRRTLSQILSESAPNGQRWNDSFRTKEEEEAQLHRKVEAIMKRERAMAYACSHQQWKPNQRLVRVTRDLRFDRYPWSWSWFSHTPAADPPQNHTTAESVASTPIQASSESGSSTRFLTRFYNHRNFHSKSREPATPQSTKSAAPFRPAGRNPGWSKSPLETRSLMTRASPASSTCDTPLKDDESLMSCPPSTRPHYMTPTISAMAKARTSSNPRERRFSLPFTPDSRNSKRDSGFQTGSQYHGSPRSSKSSVANSTLSLPAIVGRKPFNRFA